MLFWKTEKDVNGGSCLRGSQNPFARMNLYLSRNERVDLGTFPDRFDALANAMHFTTRRAEWPSAPPELREDAWHRLPRIDRLKRLKAQRGSLLCNAPAARPAVPRGAPEFNVGAFGAPDPLKERTVSRRRRKFLRAFPRPNFWLLRDHREVMTISTSMRGAFLFFSENRRDGPRE